MSPCIVPILEEKRSIFPVLRILLSLFLLHSMVLYKSRQKLRHQFSFFLDKIRNIAMSPELHSPTVTVLSPAKLYNNKMKLYTFVCLTSYKMILLMNETTHSSYFTEIIISSRFKECYLFVTLQILSSVTGVLSIIRRFINNSTYMLNSLDEGEMIWNVIQATGTKIHVC